MPIIKRLGIEQSEFRTLKKKNNNYLKQKFEA